MEWIIVGYSAGWLVTWGMALSVARRRIDYFAWKQDYDKAAIMVATAWPGTVLSVWKEWKGLQ